MLDTPRRFPLHRFPLIDTTSLDEFRAVGAGIFGARDFELRGARDNFRASMNWVWLKHIDLGYMSFTGSVGYAVTPDIVRQQFPIRGTARTSVGNQDFHVDRDQSCVIPIGSKTRHDYSPDYAEIRLRIEHGALRAKLAAMLGSPVDSEIRFEAPSAFHHPSLSRLRRLIAHLIEELDRDEDAFPELAAAHYEQSLMACFLLANRHNYSDRLAREAPPASARQVRRIEDYMDANCTLPITIEALADLTGTGAGSIDRGFRQARGISPMRFLKQIRLKHARRLLQTAADDVSVAAVASRFGFSNAGRFARDYGKTFGELPSATLMNSRRARS